MVSMSTKRASSSSSPTPRWRYVRCFPQFLPRRHPQEFYRTFTFCFKTQRELISMKLGKPVLSVELYMWLWACGIQCSSLQNCKQSVKKLRMKYNPRSSYTFFSLVHAKVHAKHTRVL
jgi:hypothetical protein